MEYKSKEITIKDLIDLIESKKLNLNPPYQRHFIWTPKDQRLLIDSIHKSYPLPSFFILKKDTDSYEMVDGQQRANTIHKYYRNEFRDSDKKLYKETNTEAFLNYRLIVIEITKENFIDGESIEEFFSLVNKRGVHLNPSEVNQAQYHDSDFLSLVNRIMDYQPLINLDIFTDKTKLRMNDRSLIEELVAYLKFGITEKRNAVDELFNMQLPEQEQNELYNKCTSVIDIIEHLSTEYPINETRYKQRNDFYTLFCFVHLHMAEPKMVLSAMYNELVTISINEFITPSNEECEPFKYYAINCVSQSNSKKARENRLSFFEELLCNKTKEGNKTIIDITTFLYQKYGFYKELKKVGDFYMIDFSNFNQDHE
jgi:hypothetical protein